MRRIAVLVLVTMMASGQLLWGGEEVPIDRGDIDLWLPAYSSLTTTLAGKSTTITVLIPPGDQIARVRGEASVKSVSTEPPVMKSVRAPGGDWPTRGSTPERNGRSPVIGPGVFDVLWSGGRPTLFSWPPFVEGDRLFTVRTFSAPPPQGTGESPIVARDLATGDEHWAVDLPLNPGDWTTWIAGVRDGRVYASRSGNGGSVAAQLHALDVVTGIELWVSAETTVSSPYDGVGFAPDGDLIIGSLRELVRINAEDGSTVWRQSRHCVISSGCGVAIHGDHVYVAEGSVIAAYDLATGARLYESEMIGNGQDSPFVGVDGTVFYARTGNNPTTDRLYAFRDTGAEMVSLWDVSSAWMVTSIHGILSDNSIITLAPGYDLVRRNGSTGEVLYTAPGGPAWNHRINVSIDGADKVYISEGYEGVRVYDQYLVPLYHFPVNNLNIGGPALAGDGILIANGADDQVWTVVPVELISFSVE